MKTLFQIMLAGSLAVGLSIFSPRLWADDTSQLKAQVQALKNRVDQLESQLANNQAAPTAMPVYNQWGDPYSPYYLRGTPNDLVNMERNMREQMDRNMHQAFANTGMMFNPRMDIKQTDKQYIITMDIPGMDKSKINVANKQGMLIVSGERRSETENNNNNNGQYYRQERSFGTFMQAIPLPEDARKDQIQARYKDGVLTVTIARMKKEEKPGGEKITVQ